MGILTEALLLPMLLVALAMGLVSWISILLKDRREAASEIALINSQLQLREKTTRKVNEAIKAEEVSTEEANEKITKRTYFK